MYESTSFKAQKEDKFSKDGAAARVPEGTIPRGFEPYHYGVNDGDKAGQELKNPLLHTKANVERGQKIFNTYCIVCHGPKGNGEGFIVPPFPRPPSLFSDKVVGWSDGRIYHVVTKGQANMPSYASQIQARRPVGGDIICSRPSEGREAHSRGPLRKWRVKPNENFRRHQPFAIAFHSGTRYRPCLPGNFIFLSPDRAWHGYLLNYYFFMAIGLGGIFFTGTQYLTNAGWSSTVRRVPEAFFAWFPDGGHTFHPILSAGATY